MTEHDVILIFTKIDSLHRKILNSNFAEQVTESEIMALGEALDLINRQRAEIEELRAMLISDGKTTYSAEMAKRAWFTQNSEFIRRLESEIERWKAESENQSVLWRNHFKSVYESGKETVRAEAIKEFAERLCEGRVSNDIVVIASQALLKEMTDTNVP